MKTAKPNILEVTSNLIQVLGKKGGRTNANTKEMSQESAGHG